MNLFLIAAAIGMMIAPSHAPGQITKNQGFAKASYILPPGLQKQGLSYCNEKVPIEKREVSVRILEQLNFLLMDRRAGMMEWFDRMSIWGPSVDKVLVQEKVPRDLIYLAVLVSDFSPTARLKNGGAGWWAIGPMKDKRNPPGGSWFSNENWDERRDPVLSTRIACGIFKAMRQQNPGFSWSLTISAYLDGIDKISGIIKKSPGFSYWDLLMPPLSDAYIPRLAAIKIIDTHRNFYSIDVPPLKAASYDQLDRLSLQKDLPLHVVAKWLRVSPRSLWELNPGVDISNGILPKSNSKGPNTLLRVPVGKGEEIRTLLIKNSYLGG